eukprot:839054-Pleurochrysis_carterae.AAC.1
MWRVSFAFARGFHGGGSARQWQRTPRLARAISRCRPRREGGREGDERSGRSAHRRAGCVYTSQRGCTLLAYARAAPILRPFLPRFRTVPPLRHNPAHTRGGALVKMEKTVRTF